MNRKFLYIILGALTILVLVVLLWWWFLRKEGTAVQTTGTFGSAQTASSTLNGTAGQQTNIGTNIPGQTGQTTQTNVELGNVGTLNNGSVGTIGTGPLSTSTIVTQAQGSITTPNVTWLSGTPSINTAGSGVSNTPGTVFNPIGINSITNSNPLGTGLIPSIDGSVGANGQQNTGSGLGGALAGAGIAGTISCALSTGINLAMQAIGLSTGTTAGTGAVVGAGAAGSAAALISVSTINIPLSAQIAALGGVTGGGQGTVAGGQNGDITVNSFLACVARTIAKVAINQITNSVVNWINSGFSGSPSFVQNPTQFLQNTADQAAGSFIKSSALSFLCSPFQLQIKVAIAQSYAQRNANSCSLTQITGNIQNFMNGNFLSGNWAGMLSFTTMPANNPYGAFIFASVGLNAATSKAQNQVKTDLAQGQGFLSFKQPAPGGCSQTSTPPPASADISVKKTGGTIGGPGGDSGQASYTVCKLITTTPGSVIQQTLIGTENSTLNSLNLAKSFDEIINALVTQLITRTLQGGLSNLSGAGGYSSNFYSSDQLQAQASAQTLLTQMQNDTSLAGQYASVEQGSISDLESSQAQLNDVYNCWNTIAQASSTNSNVQAQAAHNAAQASSTLASLNTQVNAYNDKISLANNAIVALQQLQSNALSAQSSQDISTITGQYRAAQSQGVIPTQNDITNAQQNRTTLQSQLSALDTQTSASLQQCNAQF